MTSSITPIESSWRKWARRAIVLALIAVIPALIISLLFGDLRRVDERLTQPQTLFISGDARIAASGPLTNLGPSLEDWLNNVAPSCRCRLTAISYRWTGDDRQTWFGSIAPSAAPKPQSLLSMRLSFKMLREYQRYGLDAMVKQGMAEAGIRGKPAAAEILEYIPIHRNSSRPARFVVLVDPE